MLFSIVFPSLSVCFRTWYECGKTEQAINETEGLATFRYSLESLEMQVYAENDMVQH